MEFRQLVTGFGEKVGVPDLTPDETGAVVIENELIRMTVQAVPEAGKILMHCEFGEPPAEHADQFERKMLQANFMYRGTGGATLSMDEESGRYYLCRYDELDGQNVESFCALLDSFMSLAADWRVLCDGFRGTTGGIMPRAAAARPAEKKPANVASLTSASAVPASLRGFDRG